MNWRLWGRGLIAAAISGGINGLAAWAVDPSDFNLETGAAKLAKVAFVAALSGMLLYLKQHPTPWDDFVNVGGK